MLNKLDLLHAPTEQSARDLLGAKLTFHSPKGLVSGYVVETEAYLGVEDQAAHSYGGKCTPKMAVMYQPAGTIYVYIMHTHHMLNIITQKAGEPQGILIRGLEPVDGIEIMEGNRGVTGFELTNGPGKLTKALGITKELKGQTIENSALSISKEAGKIPKKIMVSPRIGIPNKGKWTEAPLRYYVAGNPYVSRMKKSEMTTTQASWQ